MASAWIVKRSTPAGTRYVVRYRLGGRETRQRHAGTFTSRPEAEGRQRWIAGELAALRVPVIVIDTAPLETLTHAGERYLATRIDATGNTLRTYRQTFRRLGAFGDKSPGEVRAADVQEWVAGLVAGGLLPRSGSTSTRSARCSTCARSRPTRRDRLSCASRRWRLRRSRRRAMPTWRHSSRRSRPVIGSTSRSSPRRGCVASSGIADVG